MSVEQAVGSALREILIGSEPIHAPFEVSQPSGRLGFCQRLCLALLIRSPRFCHEQTLVAEHAHEVREVLMRLLLKQVADPVRSFKRRKDVRGIGESNAHITALKDANVRVIFEEQRSFEFQCCRVGDPYLPSITRFPAR